MNLDIKLLRQCYAKVLSAHIVTDTDYMPMLHGKALNLRNSLQRLDDARRSGMIKALVAMESMYSFVDSCSLNELEAYIKSEDLSDDEKKACNESIVEIEMVFKDKNAKFKKTFFDKVKEIRENRYDISESDLKEALDNALYKKSKELSDTAHWCKNVIEPLLKEIGSAISDVSEEILSITNKNIFDKAAEFVPELNITDVSKTTVEVELIKYGLQATKECLNILSSGSKVIQLVKENKSLNETRDKIKKLYEEADEQIKDIERCISEIIELIKMDGNVKTYLLQTQNLEKDIVDFAEKFNNMNVAEYKSGQYSQQLSNAIKYFKDMELMWR